MADSEASPTTYTYVPPRRRLMGLPPLSRTKDIRYSFYFQGGISRWCWRFFMYRLTAGSKWFFLVTFIGFVYGSSSLELQAYVPFLYFFAVWLLAALCLPLVRPNVTLTVEHSDRSRVGESLPVEIRVQQKRRFGLADLTIVPHELPPEVDAEPEDGARVPPLAYGQTATVRLRLRCKRRGVHRWNGFRIETDYPFGLLRAYRALRQPRSLMVYPTFTRLSRFPIPSGRRYQPGGVALASNLGESFEYIGSREFREGDNIRDLDWRATARLQTPIVREYREEYFLRVAVVLDTHIPLDAKAEARENFERAVSVAAAVSDYMARSDYIVDLFAVGPVLYHLTAGRSLAYLDQILEILACVEENPEEPFVILEPEIVENLAKITTVICIFMDWNANRQAFVQRLLREGAGVKVIVVRDTSCTLDPSDSDLPGGIPVISASDYAAGVEEL